QGIDRLALTDLVYLAVPAAGRRARGPAAERRDVQRLCRRLGLGLLIVHPRRKRVEVLLDPVPYRPRKDAARRARLLREHARRTGDPNRGGGTRRPIVTAYRQEALRCAAHLRDAGSSAVRAVRLAAEAPRAGRILYDNVYGWFE